MRAAATLGYRPNALARAMTSGRSGLIALLVAYLDNQFYPIVLERLSRILQDHGYQVMLFMTDPGAQDKVVQKILQYRVEGIVMASATMSSTLALECARTGVPVVTFNRYIPGAPVSSVVSANQDGGRMLADFLVRGGHKRIAFIAGSEDSSTSRDRESGFVQGLAAHGMTLIDRAVGGFNFSGGAAAARVLLEKVLRPDAIFVANDHMAISAIDVARREFRLRIPEDLSVVGYDDVPAAAWASYDITTVAQPLETMVSATAALLVEQIETGMAVNKRIDFPAELVLRGSARRPPRTL